MALSKIELDYKPTVLHGRLIMIDYTAIRIMLGGLGLFELLVSLMASKSSPAKFVIKNFGRILSK